MRSIESFFLKVDPINITDRIRKDQNTEQYLSSAITIEHILEDTLGPPMSYDDLLKYLKKEVHYELMVGW